MPEHLIPVGITGLGRSGWGIHAKTLRAMPEQFVITAVADPDAGRREEAACAMGCATFPSVEEMLEAGGFRVLVVASPNARHAPDAILALENGFDVVVEKPFAISTAEADAVIAAGRKHKRLVAPFQNRRYEPHFQKVREIVQSGILGEILQVRICWHGFGRRWDWQTLREFGGGAIRNNGPHMIDHGLQLLGECEDPLVFATLRNALSSGDAEDHLKLVLRNPATGRVVDLEMTSAASYPQDRWHIMGTAGGLHGTVKRLDWNWVDWSAHPPRPVDRTPTADRSYNREDLTWNSDSWEGDLDGDALNAWFYEDFHTSLVQGQPLVIPPEDVRRQIAVIEAACAKSGFYPS